MIAVIFEVYPHEEHKLEYLDIAASLKPVLEQVDGFISVERFQSLTDPKKLLSISFFENEDALEEWRNVMAHRNAQRKGRQDLFDDYRIRVSHVLRDYGMNEREEVPADSKAAHSS